MYSHILNIKMRCNLASATPETYEFKIAVFKNFQPQELHGFLKNSKKANYGTGNNTVAGHINYLHTMICGEALREFKRIMIPNNRKTNAHPKHIQEGFLGYFSWLMPFKSRRWQCITRQGNLSSSPWKGLIHDWLNWITTCPYSLDCTTWRKCKKRS